MDGAEAVDVSTGTGKLYISLSLPSLTDSGTAKDFTFQRPNSEVAHIDID